MVWTIQSTRNSRRIADRLSRMIQVNFADQKSVGEDVSEILLKFGFGYRIYQAVCDEKIVFLLASEYESIQREDIPKAKELIKELP